MDMTMNTNMQVVGILLLFICVEQTEEEWAFAQRQTNECFDSIRRTVFRNWIMLVSSWFSINIAADIECI